MRVVDQLEVVHVGKEQQEGAGSAAATCQGIVEHARVEDAGEEVTFRELAKLSEVPPVLVREPADQDAARGVGDEADHGRSGEDVARRQARGYHDRERVERRGDDAAQQAESCSARQREQRDRDVEEVPEPEAGDLEGDEDHEDDHVAPDCDHGEQAPLERCRRHGKVSFVPGRGATRPSKE